MVKPKVALSVLLGLTQRFTSDESLEENVNHELMEEAGYKASSVKLYEEIVEKGLFNTKYFVSYAYGLEKESLPNPDGDVVKAVEPIHVDDLYTRVMNREFEAQTNIAYALLKFLIDLKAGNIFV